MWTDEGTWSAGGSFFLNSNTYLGSDIGVDLYLGNYIRNFIMVGGYLGITDNDLSTTASIGAACKYHFFDNGRNLFSPYVGARLGLIYFDTFDDDSFALELRGNLGIDYFLAPNVAVNFEFSALAATDDVYIDNTELTNTDVRLSAGLGFFF